MVMYNIKRAQMGLYHLPSLPTTKGYIEKSIFNRNSLFPFFKVKKELAQQNSEIFGFGQE